VQNVLVDFRIAKYVLGEVQSSWIKYTIPRYRPKDNIRKILKEIGWEGVDQVDLAQDTSRDRWWALVNTVIQLLIP
jgi:hypothetical protein